MAELRIHAFSWCIHHQQPVVALTPDDSNANGENLFWVGLSVEDAQALCQVDTWPPSGRRRVHKLVSDVLQATDSQLDRISLEFNGDAVLTATLTLTTPAGPNMITCGSVDAILMATEHGMPLTMEDHKWQALQAFVETGGDDTRKNLDQMPQPPDVFRDFIETLDLNQEHDL